MPGGRPKGSPNKTSKDTRQTILNTFTKLGGEKFMLEWAKQEPTEFMKIYAKLLPREEKVTMDATVAIKQIERIIIKPNA